jgi:hypothetical protein
MNFGGGLFISGLVGSSTNAFDLCYELFLWRFFPNIHYHRPMIRSYLWLYSPDGPLPLFQFLNLYIVGRTPWTGDQAVARPLPTHRTTQTRNKCTQTSMSWVGFEPTIPVFQRAKTVHALDRAVTVIGYQKPFSPNYCLRHYLNHKQRASEREISGLCSECSRIGRKKTVAPFLPFATVSPVSSAFL